MKKVDFTEAYIPEPNSGCWLWLGHITQYGYGGSLTDPNDKKKRILAHCISWTLHFGKIPDGLFVLHRCDTKACVNPNHLFLGTKKDNTHDAMKKGRLAFGERNGQAKITKEVARAIKESTDSITETAIKFGLSYRHVHDIMTGRRWRHLSNITKLREMEAA